MDAHVRRLVAQTRPAGGLDGIEPTYALDLHSKGASSFEAGPMPSFALPAVHDVRIILPFELCEQSSR